MPHWFAVPRPRSLLAATLVLIGCRDAEPSAAKPAPEQQSPAAPEQQSPAASVEPGVRDDGSIVSAVAWFEGSFEQALARAKAEGKLVVLDVGAYWCPPCHELDEQTFTDPRVGAWLRERAVALHVDAEKDEGPELEARYHVQAYPTLLVLDADGIEKGRIVDFISADALLPKLDALAKGDNVLAELEAAVETQPNDLAALYELGHAYVLAARRTDAEQVFARVLAADPDNAHGFASKVRYDTALFFTLKLDDAPEQAIRELEQLQATYPHSPEATKAYRMIGRALCQLDRDDEAVAVLQAMVATKPDDVDLKASFGWFAFRQNCRPDAGLAAVLAGIEQAPDNAELRYLEAELRRLVGEGEAALAAIRKASALEPDNAYYRRQLARFTASPPRSGGPADH